MKSTLRFLPGLFLFFYSFLYAAPAAAQSYRWYVRQAVFSRNGEKIRAKPVIIRH